VSSIGRILQDSINDSSIFLLSSCFITVHIN
jgi:hypothetical protein